MSTSPIKWVGGKRKLLPALTPLLPKTWERYFEPFLGGGALFFHLHERLKIPYLSDANGHLIGFYRVLRDCTDELCEAVEELASQTADLDMDRCCDVYYEVRAERNADPDTGTIRAAARFFYLNQVGFNGLYRENKSGGFNVPFGRRMFRPDLDKLRAAATALDKATLEVGPYTTIMPFLQAGDFVYLDPPYIPLSATSSFSSYTSNGFGRLDQMALAVFIERAAALGVHVMLSNSSTPVTREIFQGLHVNEVKAPRAVSAKGSSRGKVSELILTTYPTDGS